MMIRLLLLRVLLLFSCVYSFPFNRGIVDVHNPLRKSTLDCSTSLDVVHVNPTEENQVCWYEKHLSSQVYLDNYIQCF